MKSIRVSGVVAFAGAAMAALFAGCSADSGELRVKVHLVSPAAESGVVKVQVNDLRRELKRERTTLGRVSMGRISLEPHETELVRQVVAAQAVQALARNGVSESQVVLCGIRAFDVVTPAAALYWDVQTRVELVLRVRGQDRTVSAMATERTYVWPSAEIISRVTGEAMQRIGVESGSALEALFAR
jgi:hypothetical protein